MSQVQQFVLSVHSYAYIEVFLQKRVYARHALTWGYANTEINGAIGIDYNTFSCSTLQHCNTLGKINEPTHLSAAEIYLGAKHFSDCIPKY